MVYGEAFLEPSGLFSLCPQKQGPVRVSVFHPPPADDAVVPPRAFFGVGLHPKSCTDRRLVKTRTWLAPAVSAGDNALGNNAQ